MKAKAELATTRIKCLLERLASYSFNLYYVKGKDMILADYLSRHRHRHDDPNDLIPISFRLTHPINPESKLPVCPPPMLTRRLAKAVGVEPPPVHGADKAIDPHKKPEHQKPTLRGQSDVHPLPTASAPVPVPKPKSRMQELARKLLDCSKALHHRQAQKSTPPTSDCDQTCPGPTPCFWSHWSPNAGRTSDLITSEPASTG